MVLNTYKLTAWQQLRYYVAFGIIYVVSLLPLPVLYVLSDMLFPLVYHVARYRRKIVAKNLRESFPEKSDDELRRIQRAFYHFLCDYFVEELKLFSISPDELRRRMVFKNYEQVEHYLRSGRSVILYFGHYCNWDWISAIPLYMWDGFRGSQVYHVLENHVADKLMLYPRARMGNKNVAMHEVLRHIVNSHKAGQPVGIGMASDQVPTWNNIGHWLTFLNHPNTPVLVGAEKLARRFDIACMYLDIRRPRRGYYEATFHLVTDTPQTDAPMAQTEKYYSMLEQTIRREPHLWLWTHNRWKRTREQYDAMYGDKAKQPN